MKRLGITILLTAAACDPNSKPDPNPPTEDPVVARALEHVHQLGWHAGIDDSAERLIARTVAADPDGTEHVLFRRELDGVPVIGGEVWVHSDGKHAFDHFSIANARAITVATSPQLSSADAVARARTAATMTSIDTEDTALVIDAIEAPRLAWQVTLSGPTGNEATERVALIDASTGSILHAWDGIQTELGLGHSLYDGDLGVNGEVSGNEFRLGDSSRFIEIRDNQGMPKAGLDGATPFLGPDNDWGTGKNDLLAKAGRETAAVDVMWAVVTTKDVFETAFDYSGWDNKDGNGTVGCLRVHVGEGWDNASFRPSTKCLGFGDGTFFKPLVSLDVVAHEYTHGLTDRTAGLIYSSEPGGLNEASSDILATYVEHAVNASTDPPDYLIGERIMKAPNAYLRTMIRPSDDGASLDCWSNDFDVADPHRTSGPANRFFYLLAEGSASAPPPRACAGAEQPMFEGIGIEKAARIWFRALTREMTSTTDYYGARTATLRVAQALYGNASAEVKAVDKAWRSVNVLPRGFLRGDANADGVIDISDPIYTLQWLFSGGVPDPLCAQAVDANADGAVDVSDPLFTLQFLFNGGKAPNDPPDACVLEASPSPLSCNAYPAQPKVCAPAAWGAQSADVTAAQLASLRELPGGASLANLVCAADEPPAACTP